MDIPGEGVGAHEHIFCFVVGDVGFSVDSYHRSI